MTEQNTNENITGPNEDEGINPYYLIKVLWKYKILIIIITFLAALSSVIYVLTATKQYQSIVSIYPITTDQGGPLKELAATLGLGVKPEGYYLPDVIFSRRIMKRVISKKYKVLAFKDSVDLIQYFELDQLPISENMRYEYAIKSLKLATALREDKETALITLTINTKETKLSADIAQSYIDNITYYLQNELKTQIKQSISFTETRLNEVSVSLENAEEDLLNFQEKNARLTSPFLSLQVKRKLKNISLITDVEVLLRKQLELLKIEEERSKPVMNILDPPDIYEKRTRPLGRKIVINSTFITFILSFLICLTHDNFKNKGIIEKLKGVIKN